MPASERQRRLAAKGAPDCRSQAGNSGVAHFSSAVADPNDYFGRRTRRQMWFGLAGFIGFIGLAGFKGLIGLAGLSGLSGLAGFIGLRGSAGLFGFCKLFGP